MSEDTTTEYEAYSDYQQVSKRIGFDIREAARAASTIQRVDAEGSPAKPREIAKAGAKILSPALLLRAQLEMYEGSNDTLDRILDDWTGEDGYIARLKASDLLRDESDFVVDFAAQMQTVGLELGYLQAGREETKREIDDERDHAVDEMF
jgi:hypothetical protein